RISVGNENDESDFAETSAILTWLGGRYVRIYRRQNQAPTMISYREVLPSEFAPLLVLDANGEQRTTYRLWEEERGNLQFLPSPTKTYGNLTIHLFDHA